MQDPPERTTAGLPIAGMMRSETPRPPSGAYARPQPILRGPRTLRRAPHSALAPWQAGAPDQPHGLWPSPSLPIGLRILLRAGQQDSSWCGTSFKAIRLLLASRQPSSSSAGSCLMSLLSHAALSGIRMVGQWARTLLPGCDGSESAAPSAWQRPYSPGRSPSPSDSRCSCKGVVG